MFAITGASGRLGRLTLAALVDRVGAAGVVAVTRTPGAVAQTRRVRTRTADFADPATLPAAFDGVRRLLLISADRTPGRLALHRAAIGAAVAAGVEHVVYTSVVRAADPGNPVPEALDHGRTEALLTASGLAHTVLRVNVWPDLLLLSGLARLAVSAGELPSSAGDGRVGYVSRADTALAAAALLAGEGAPPGRLLDFTGPGLTDGQVASALTEATGRPVRHRPVADHEVAGALTALGVPPALATGWGENDPFRRAGWFDVPEDGTARRLLGREPVTLTDFFASHRTELLGG
ncbi:NAD(P)H-binding protein [Kitasatospora sp. SUK 42]|uniref:NAD(P)H-binding protein n=1 Tax=Kitasatospora sp. SUK 42 TaxID=1588882 RepID=UPI0018CA46F1|nr:NAD(P)H-binding protein [Kitasatospora sp. SUK 42]MBV2156316.1 NAD(P)H-binding protein [Kitasatospora sp. SUK 42]